MTTNPSSIPISLSPELLECLKVYQETQNIKSVSIAIVDVLMQFFKLDNYPVYASAKQLEALEQKVERLSLQVQQLSQLSLKSTFTSTTSTLNTLIEQDDIEDEPDEILYGFLPDNERL
jgi:hypothetical protein